MQDVGLTGGGASFSLLLLQWKRYLIRRVLYSISSQHLSKILCAAHYVLRPAEPNAVVIIGQLGLGRGKFVDLESYLVPLQRVAVISQPVFHGQ